MMPGSLSLIMPDGRVVALSDTAINMISDMSSLEEVDENKTQTGTEDSTIGHSVTVIRENPAEQFNNDHDLKFEDFLEEVLCYKCKVCSQLGESKAQMLDHMRENHSEECRTITAIMSTPAQEEPSGENKNIEISAENNIAGLSFILNDTGGVGDRNVVTGGSKVLMLSGPPEKEMLVCGGCSLCYESEEEMSRHLATSLSCAASYNSSSVKLSIMNKSEAPSLREPDVTVVVEATNEADHLKRVLPCTARSCNFRFKHRSQLQYHLKCHNSDSPDFSCVECEQKFEKWRECGTHLWRVHAIDCDMLLCRYCPYRTLYPKILEAHYQTHRNLKEFKCDVCGKRFNQMSQLKNHAVIHLDKTIAELPSWAKPKQCDICQKMFSDSKSLKKHVQAIHSKLKPYICNVCNHKSARKAMLQLHMRQHTGEKPFSCQECDYKTGDHNSLRRHMRRHSGVKPYKCPYCPYAAIQSSSYRSHLKSKHPDRQARPDTDEKGGQVFQVEADSDLGLSSVILVGLDKNVTSTPTPFEDISVAPTGSLEMQL